jgi:hypothetical protein
MYCNAGCRNVPGKPRRTKLPLRYSSPAQNSHRPPYIQCTGLLSKRWSLPQLQLHQQLRSLTLRLSAGASATPATSAASRKTAAMVNAPAAEPARIDGKNVSTRLRGRASVLPKSKHTISPSSGLIDLMYCCRTQLIGESWPSY